MKLTGAEIENVFEALQNLNDTKFNISTGYKIANLLKEIQPKYIEIVNGREELIQKYGDRNEQGEIILENNQAHISSEFSEEAQNKLNEIYNKIYDIEGKYIQIDELEETKLSLKQISKLMPILEK